MTQIADSTVDPDIAQAIDDFRGHGEALRVIALRRARAPDPDPRQRHDDAEVARMMADIRLRADRLAIEPEALLLLINDDLDRRARRGRPAPRGETSRTLTTAVSAAETRANEARRALEAAQREADAAERSLVAARQACRAFGGGKLGAHL